MKKLALLALCCLSLKGITEEEYREITATLKLLKYCNTMGSQMKDTSETWPYPETFHRRATDLKGRNYGIPTQAFESVCKNAADKLLELTKK